MGRPARTQEVTQERRRRTGSDSARNLKLHVPEGEKDPSFEYRWINNKPGRVKQLTVMDDWDVVSSPDAAIEGDQSATGTVVSRTVDRREGEEAILVRKPRHFYEADKAKELAPLEARDEEMRRGKVEGAGALSGSEAYVPGGHKGREGRNIVSGK